MSEEPKRFDSVIEMLTHDCHKYALENARLKAEVERLRASSFVTAVPVDEYEKLKAEVERLTERNKFLEQIDSYLQGANENAYEKRCDELEAEVERLTAELSNISGWGRGLESDLSHARVEVSFLKAEVERLRKAGDAMEISLQADFNGCPYEPLIIRKAIHRWRAAKEGKQP